MNINDQINNKEFEYFDYIVEHKRNILTAYNILCKISDYYFLQGVDFLQIHNFEEKLLRQNIIAHDLSKFSKEEFDDYRMCFYPKNYIEKETGDFESAWKHHYENSKHHPEYWQDKISDMDKVYMLEMICDWVAMSIKFKNSPLEYFRDKKQRLKENFGDKLDYEYIDKILLAIENLKDV